MESSKKSSPDTDEEKSTPTDPRANPRYHKITGKPGQVTIIVGGAANSQKTPTKP
jgi:hypothetical protein